MAAGSTPTVTGGTATSITYNSAIVTGKVTVSGGSTVTARGTTWSVTTGATPTGNSHTVDGAGVGDFTSAMSGLIQNTKYYYRAYAVNSTGIGYGTEKNLTTLIQQITSDSLRFYERTGIFGGTPTPEQQLAMLEANAIDLTENSIDKQD
jgi:hypothetical protein